MVDSLNSAFKHGELSSSQKQGIIKLIDKKNKDRRHITNWRPISLLNVDTKIASKAIAVRLEKVLPELISEEQCAYVKGRNIFEVVRTISDIMEHTHSNGIPGLMVTIDFEKAFDSVSWSFLNKTLHKLNFGDSFIKWVNTFYKDVSSCIMNNGVGTALFPIKRGVRQGDPLSPYLFILVLEPLLSAIKEDPTIRGLQIIPANTKEREKRKYLPILLIFKTCHGENGRIAYHKRAIRLSFNF